MRILILGGNGMLGHRAALLLSERHDITCTLRRPDAVAAGIAPRARFVTGVSADDTQGIADLMSEVRPEAVLNCIGIVKQRDASHDALPSIAVNALFPHQVARLCAAAGARFVHVSTDCVFSGDKGGYVEDDFADADDLYGRTKYLGEVSDVPGSVTVRTSIVGWEIRHRTGVLEWFATRRETGCDGWTRAVFSGLATSDLVEVIEGLCTTWSDVDGLWHVSAEPIDKFTLLTSLRDALGWATPIEPVEEPAIDRSLDSSAFRGRTGWGPRAWAETVGRLAQERVEYEKLELGG